MDEAILPCCLSNKVDFSSTSCALLCQADMHILFYSRQLGCYYIASSDVMVGAHTGVDGFTAVMYQVEDTVISQYQSWEWVNLIHDWNQLDVVQQAVEAADWPYLNSQYVSFRNEETLSSCI